MTPHKGSVGSRRNVLKAIGGVALTGSLAGCSGSGGNGGGGSSGGGSSGGGSSGGGSESTATPTAAPPSYNAAMGIVATELNQIPSIAAMREMLPAASDGRLTGSVRTFRTATLAIQALVSGSIDYYALSPGNVFQAQLAGNDPRVLATKVKGTDYLFITQPDITSLAQIVEEDRAIGVAGLGGLSHMQVAGVFRKEGYDLADVNIQQLGGSSTRTSAVASGNIDATIIHIDQYRSIQEQGFEGNNLFALRDYFPNFISQTITVPGKFLEDENTRAHAEQYIHQMVKANARATTDFDWTYSMAEKYQAETLAKEDAEESWRLNAETISAWPYRKEDYTRQDYSDQMETLIGAEVMTEAEADEVDLDRLLNTEFYEAGVDAL